MCSLTSSLATFIKEECHQNCLVWLSNVYLKYSRGVFLLDKLQYSDSDIYAPILWPNEKSGECDHISYKLVKM